MSIFSFSDAEALGKVSAVDTGTVTIDVEDVDQLKRLQVNRLVVLHSSRPGQHLIGLVQKVVRKKLITDPEDPGKPSEENLCRIALIGTLIDREGIAENVFRRTLETVPEIEAHCFSLEGEHLTSFMQVIAQASGEGSSLNIGKYTLDV